MYRFTNTSFKTNELFLTGHGDNAVNNQIKTISADSFQGYAFAQEQDNPLFTVVDFSKANQE